MQAKHLAIGALAVGIFAAASQLTPYKNPPQKYTSDSSSILQAACVSKDGKPDKECNPGTNNPNITQATISKTICNPAWSTKSIRPSTSYTNPIKLQEIMDYNYTDTDPTHYELDHIESLEIGGNPTDLKNLFPEPYCVTGGGCIANDPRAAKDPLGAKSKDKIENKCHAEVCSGKITLAEAQKEISSDWTTACK